MNPIFVTGATGFVGSHLSKLCAVTALKGSVTDYDNIKEQLEVAHPQLVIHLAAQSHVGSSYQSPRLTYEVNFLGTFNLIEALKAVHFKGRLLYVSSADVYGAAEALPIDENHPCQPVSPYAVSKRAAELLCQQEKAFDIIIARPFNHIGPRQNPLFALPSFVRQLKAIQRGEQEPVLRVGNLQTTRDFCDVRDIVKGYLDLLEKGQPGHIYNLCGGQEYLMNDVLSELISLSTLKITLQEDPGLLRAQEQKRMVGSFQKIYKTVGWEPKIPLRASLQDIWEQ